MRVQVTASSVATSLGAQVTKDGARFAGNNKYYAMDRYNLETTHSGTTWLAVQIDNDGIIQDIIQINCNDFAFYDGAGGWDAPDPYSTTPQDDGELVYYYKNGQNL